MFKMGQTCSNLIKLYPNGSMWFKWIKLIQNRSNFYIKVLGHKYFRPWEGHKYFRPCEGHKYFRPWEGHKYFWP